MVITFIKHEVFYILKYFQDIYLNKMHVYSLLILIRKKRGVHDIPSFNTTTNVLVEESKKGNIEQKDNAFKFISFPEPNQLTNCIEIDAEFNYLKQIIESIDRDEINSILELPYTTPAQKTKAERQSAITDLFIKYSESHGIMECIDLIEEDLGFRWSKSIIEKDLYSIRKKLEKENSNG